MLDSTPWSTSFTRSAYPTVKMFCFPYAGGSSSIFRSWSLHFPDAIQIVPIELPGRGNRFDEKPFSKLGRLIGELSPTIAELADRPFVFFGHSLGALVSFEVCRWLRRHKRVLPIHLFVSGRRAPHLPNLEPPIHAANDVTIISYLRQLNGTPPDILDNPDILKLILPTLRADFALSETHKYSHEEPLDCDITALGGTEDCETAGGRLAEWRRHTAGHFMTYMLPGNHFFLHSSQDTLVHILRREISRCTAAL